jgi:hypothetical protein
MGEGRLSYTKVGARRLIPRRALVQVLAEGLTPAAQNVAVKG